MQPVIPDKNEFITLTTMKMPFGKYKGLRLVDLPEPYLIWSGFTVKGFQRVNWADCCRPSMKLNSTAWNIFSNRNEDLYRSIQICW